MKRVSLLLITLLITGFSFSQDYEPIQGSSTVHYITSSSTGSGHITPSGVVEVEHGGSQNYRIYPATRYYIKSVMYGEQDVTDDLTTDGEFYYFTAINVTESKNLHVELAPITYTITVEVGDNGSVSPSGLVVVNQASSKEFIITPDPGCEIDKVFYAGVDVTSTMSYGQVLVDALSNERGDEIISLAEAESSQTFTVYDVTEDATLNVSFKRPQYTISVVSGLNGSVNPSGIMVVDHGDDKAFTITPDPGYEIDVATYGGSDIKGSLTGSGDIKTFTASGVISDATLNVSFKIKQYTISVVSGSDGSVNPSGIMVVDHGDDKAFTITPDVGYEIDVATYGGVDIKGSLTGSGDIKTFAASGITSDATLNVSFKKKQYTISVVSGSDGSVSPSGSVLVDHGDDKTFTITPNTGYEIDVATYGGADIKGSLTGSGDTKTFTASGITSDATLNVSFNIKQYTISVVSGSNGSVDSQISMIVDHGDDITFTITPDVGYEIDVATYGGADIKGSLTGSGDIKRFTASEITSDATLNVSFKIKQYTISVVSGSNGYVSPLVSVIVDHGGDDIVFTITPDVGYEIDVATYGGVDIIGLLTGSGDIKTFTASGITSDATLNVSFKIKRYTISVVSGSNGSVSPSGSVVVDHNSTRQFSITPDVGYEIDKVFYAGVDVTSTMSYGEVLIDALPNEVDNEIASLAEAESSQTFTVYNVTSDATLNVSFKKKQYTISVVSGLNGSVNPSGSVVVDHGDDKAFTITPNTGYEIDVATYGGADIIGLLTGSGDIKTFTALDIISDAALNVSFKKRQYTISVVSGSNGSVNPSGSVLVDHGDDKTFTITPDVGYEIDVAIYGGADIKGSLTGTGDIKTFTASDITTGATLNVSFKTKRYTVSVVLGSNGSVSPSVSVVVDHGGDKIFTITPNTGYEIDVATYGGVDVKGSLTGSGDIKTFTASGITSDATLNVSFKIKQYTVSIVSRSNGSVSPSGLITVDYAGDKQLTISPDNDYYIKSIKVNGIDHTDEVIVVGSTYRFTISNIIENKVVAIEFSDQKYSVITNINGNGSISPEGTVMIKHGDDQQFEISIDDTYQIESAYYGSLNIKSDLIYENGKYIYTASDVTSSNVLNVITVRDGVTIISSSGDNGKILPEGTVSLPYLSNKTFMIVPDFGYEISTILCNGVDVKDELVEESTFSSITLNSVVENKTLDVNFKSKIHSLSIPTPSNGSVSPSGNMSITHGESLNLSIQPDDGYELDKILFNDNEINARVIRSRSGGVLYSIGSILFSGEVTTVFKPKEYNVTINSGVKGKVSRTGNKNITVNDDLTFTILPDPGYMVSRLVLNGKSVIDLIQESDSGYKLSVDKIDSDLILEVEYTTIDFNLNISSSIGGTVTPYGDMVITVEDEHIIEMRPETNYNVSSFTVNGNEKLSEVTCPEGVCVYTVKEIVANTDIVIQFSNTSTAVGYANKHSVLNVYPNPVKDQLSIVMRSNINKGLLTILSVTGEVIYREFNYQGNTLDVSNLNPGVYLLRIIESDNIHEAIFVKY